MLSPSEQESIEAIRLSQNEIEKAHMIESYFSLHPKRKIVHLAKNLSVSVAYISRYKRLLRLPELVTDGYLAGTISASHLFVLSRLKNQDDMVEIYEKILSQTLAVHQIENLIRSKLFAVDTLGEKVDEKIHQGLEEVAAWLDKDCKIELIQTRIGVKLVLTLPGNREKTTRAINKLAKRLEINH